MKGIKFIIILFFLIALIAGPVYAHNGALPFNLQHYGSFKKMIETRNLEGIIELHRVALTPHTTGVGIVKNAEGEITIRDGEVWINYGADGIEKTAFEIPKGEQAVLLVTAQVEKWQEIIIPGNMSEAELHSFMLEQARKSGLNTRMPIPFLLEGNFKDLVWSVLDGVDAEASRRTKQLLLRKLVAYREQASAVFIGFYAAELSSEITQPGEPWHMHVIFKDEKTTGHVNTFSVVKGAKLKLPAR